MIQTGALLGPGIYTASRSNVALYYAHLGNSDQNERMLFGKEVLLECERAYAGSHMRKRHDTMTGGECDIYVTTDATDLLVRDIS
jgi:hypothetical protein